MHSRPSTRSFARLLPAAVRTGALLLAAVLASGGPATAQSSHLSPLAQGTSHGFSTSHSQTARPLSPGLQRLLPPAGMGSAANVPPGFYRQLSVPQHFSHGHDAHHAPHHAPHLPLVVYVNPYPVDPHLPVAATQLAPPPAPSQVPVAAPAPRPAAQQPQVIVVPAEALAPRQAPRRPAEPAPEPEPRSTEPGEVRLEIEPPEAQVFLDDDYLGSGAEAEALEIVLSPRVYVLEVNHPDHPTKRLVFGVNPQETTYVSIDLTAERSSRRSRVR